MTDSKIPVAGAGLDLNSTTKTTGAGLVHDEGITVNDPTDPTARAAVKATAPAAAEFGVVVREPEPGAAALSSVGQSATTVALLAANALRRGLVIVNEQPTTEQGESLYVAFAATTTLTAYTHRLAPGEKWERRGGYTGAISGFWSAGGTGAARVTEES